MRTLWLVLLLVVATGVGVGIGWMLGSGDERVRSGSRDPSAVRPQRERVEPGTSPRPMSVEGQGTLREVLAIPVPTVREASGTGTITGKVVTGKGAPVGDVLVRAMLILQRAGASTRWVEGSGPPPDRDLEEMIREELQREVQRRATRRDGRTGVDGTYRIEGLGGGKYHVRAYRRGYVLKAAAGTRTHGVTAGATVDFVAEERIELPVTVLLPDGAVAENVSVRCKQRTGRGTSNRSVRWYSDDPILRLAVGEYTLQASQGDLLSPETPVSLTLEHPPTAVTLRLEARPGVRGRVRFPDGQQSENAVVYLARLPAGREPDPEWLRSEARLWVNVQVQDTYKFEDLAPGTYSVGAARAGREIEVLRTVQVVGQVVVQDLEFPTPDAADYLSIEVRGPAGKPVAVTSATLSYRAKSRRNSSTVRPIRRKDGTLVVPRYGRGFPREPEGGRYFVRLASPQFGEVEREYSPKETQELVFRFEEPGTLEVKIGRYQGSGHEEHLRLYLKRRYAGLEEATYTFHTRYSQREIDGEGHRTFRALQPGAYEVALQALVTRGHGIMVATVPVQVRAGTNRVTVPIPPLYTVTVVVSGGPDARVRLHSGEKRVITPPRKPGSDGKLRFERLPAGEYELWKLGPDGKTERLEITLPGQQVVDF